MVLNRENDTYAFLPQECDVLLRGAAEHLSYWA